MDSALDGLVDELTRALVAEHRFEERLGTYLGAEVRVGLLDGPDLGGTLMDVGDEHLWLADVDGSWLISMTAVTTFVSSARRRPRLEAGSGVRATGFTSALRTLASDQRDVSVLLGGRRLDGRLVAIGHDFVQVETAYVPLARIHACRIWY